MHSVNLNFDNCWILLSSITTTTATSTTTITTTTTITRVIIVTIIRIMFYTKSHKISKTCSIKGSHLVSWVSVLTRCGWAQTLHSPPHAPNNTTSLPPSAWQQNSRSFSDNKSTKETFVKNNSSAQNEGKRENLFSSLAGISVDSWNKQSVSNKNAYRFFNPYRNYTQ